MSYNRNNLLQRIIIIQNIVLDHKTRGVTQKWVYDNLIYPTYKISFRTYNEYLGINAKGELAQLRKKKAMEPTLF